MGEVVATAPGMDKGKENNTLYSINPRQLSVRERILASLIGNRDSSVVQTVKNLPTMQETWVRSLGWEDPLETGMTIHSSTFA